LVHQVVEHRRERRRGSGSEPHADDGGAPRDDLELRAGQRAKQPRTAADRDVDLNPAGRQMSLYVRL
jgi:hypothetical protein